MSRFLVPLLFLLAAIGVFVVFTQPKIDTVKAQRADIAIYNEALDNGQKLISVREKLVDKFNAFKDEDVERLKKTVPDAIDNVRLIIDLDDMAGQYGMELKNVRVLTPSGRSGKEGALGSDSQKYGSVGLGFTVTGTYEVFRRFVADLEKSLRILDIVSVSFSSNDRNTYDFSLEIRTYWLK